MTDLLCESAKLDDWMKEVESAGTPETFQDDSPANEEAGVLSCHPAAWATATPTVAAIGPTEDAAVCATCIDTADEHNL